MLSLPEILNRDPKSGQAAVHIPPSIKHLLSDNTFLLLNKVDLVSSSEVDATLQGLGAHKAWTVSLNTGEGTHSFLQSFGKALQER